MKRLTKREAEQFFKELYPHYKELDQGAKRLYWGVFTDGLCKDGLISQYQYNSWVYPRWLIGA